MQTAELVGQPLRRISRGAPDLVLSALHRAPSVWKVPTQPVYLVSGHREVARALSDSRFRADRCSASGAHAALLRRMMLFLTGEEHRQVRGTVKQAFTVAEVKALEPKLYDHARRWVKRLEPGRAFDLIEELAYPFPLYAISSLLGIEDAPSESIRRWSAEIATVLDPTVAKDSVRVDAALRQCAAFLRAELRARRSQPKQDVLSLLARGDELSAVANAMLLLIAGHETTSNWIASSIWRLTERPDLRPFLVDSPSLRRAFAWEVLRLDSPVQVSLRVVGERVTLGGVSLSPSERVLLHIGAAGRDPAVYPEPNRFRLDRAPFRLAFGHGPHFCLGMWLAEVETLAVLNAFAERFQEWSVRGRPQFSGTIYLRSVRRLVVECRESVSPGSH